jgi:hypothetical protein
VGSTASQIRRSVNRGFIWATAPAAGASTLISDFAPPPTTPPTRRC